MRAALPFVAIVLWITFAAFSNPAAAADHKGPASLIRCGVDERGPGVAIPREIVQRWAAEGRLQTGGVIPVRFHVIYHAQSQGNVPDQWIADQITVLNRTFAGQDYAGNPVPGAAATGYSFVLASVDRTKSNVWYNMAEGSQAEQNAKGRLAISPGSSLNIWTANTPDGVLGWAVFPWLPQAGTAQDGIVVNWRVLPGGPLAPYNLGGTVAHEVGHYLGLYHTFKDACGFAGLGDDPDSCATLGDLVCDTASENLPTQGCPTGKNTCPTGGDDPIHNYMDYSDDACYNNFTPGQDARMNAIVTGNASRSWIGATRVANGTGATNRNHFESPSRLTVRPNPFNPRARLEYQIRRAGHVLLRVFDVRGREVIRIVDGQKPPGVHAVDFDATGMASGIYWVMLTESGSVSQSARMVLMR